MQTLPSSILLPVDLDGDPNQSLTWGVSVAKRFGASLTLIYISASSEEAGIKLASLRDLARQAENELGYAPDGDKRVEYEIISALRTVEAISEFAETHNNDLILQVTREHAGLMGFFSSSSATASLLDRSPCPVLSVPKASLDSNNTLTYSQILVATDLVHLPPLYAAKQLSTLEDVNITYLHVIPLNDEGAAQYLSTQNSASGISEIAEHATEKVQLIFTQYPELKPNKQVGIIGSVGFSSDVILEQVNQGMFDLIIAGHNQLGFIEDLITKSVSKTLIKNAQIPVLIINENH